MKTEHIVLTARHTHLEVGEDGREHPRTFAAGQHQLPAEIAASARAAGLVDEEASAAANAVRASAPPRVRKPAAKKPAPTPAAAKTPGARKR